MSVPGGRWKISKFVHDLSILKKKINGKTSYFSDFMKSCPAAQGILKSMYFLTEIIFFTLVFFVAKI